MKNQSELKPKSGDDDKEEEEEEKKTELSEIEKDKSIPNHEGRRGKLVFETNYIAPSKPVI